LGPLNEHGGTLTVGNLHAAIELTLLPFNLQGRRPECAGNTVAEAAPKLLDRRGAEAAGHGPIRVDSSRAISRR
jgi:hypothetical protein